MVADKLRLLQVQRHMIRMTCGVRLGDSKSCSPRKVGCCFKIKFSYYMATCSGIHVSFIPLDTHWHINEVKELEIGVKRGEERSQWKFWEK